MSSKKNSKLKNLKNYLKLGRSFGTTNTWGAIFVGVLTSSVIINAKNIEPLKILADAFRVLAISFFAHAYMGAINEYWHIEEDKKHPQYKYKPLVRGDISKKNAKIYIYFCLIFAIVLSFAFYRNYSTIFLVLGAAFGTLYTIKGKYISWAYDLTPSVGAAFLIFYGATTIGQISSVTIVAAICAFLLSMYSEWVDGMKDVETDKKFKVPTTAVRWGYNHNKPLTIKDPNFIYFLIILISLDIVYSMPYFFKLLSPTYFYIFLLLVVPMQGYLVYKIHGKQNKESLRRHPIIFIGTTMFLAFVLVIDKITILGVIGIFIFVIGWVFVFSIFGIQFSQDKFLIPLK
jgi:4-hydroxybenzoate polyprenyltransferase